MAIKKGSSEGTTELAQSHKPSFVADIFCLEKSNKQIVKIQNKKGNIFFLKDRHINFII